MHFVSAEALLEMYYLQATLQELAKIFGHASLRLIKPSQSDEAWVAMDQAWVATKESDEDFLASIRDAAHGIGKPRHYFALLRQYKRVEKITRASSHTPYRGVSGKEWYRPYFRAELSTQPGLIREGLNVTGSKHKAPPYSQHEALVTLSALKETDVQYVCPMVVGAVDVWKPADLTSVRLVSVHPTDPKFSSDSKRHFLCFRDEHDSNPEFHSDEGVPTNAVDFQTWAASVKSRLPEMKRSPEQALSLLLTISSVFRTRINQELRLRIIEARAISEARSLLSSKQLPRRRLAKELPESLCFFEVTMN